MRLDFPTGVVSDQQRTAFRYDAIASAQVEETGIRFDDGRREVVLPRTDEEKDKIKKPAPPPAVQDTAPPPDPAGQLATMNAFLETVESTRSELPAFLGSCAYAASDADTLAQTVQERDQAVNQATALRTDDILDGDRLRQALVTMARAMLTADKKYLTWAQRAASSGSCSDAGGSSFDQANQAAADAKRAFVKVWKGDADKYGQPTYTWNDF